MGFLVFRQYRGLCVFDVYRDLIGVRFVDINGLRGCSEVRDHYGVDEVRARFSDVLSIVEHSFRDTLDKASSVTIAVRGFGGVIIRYTSFGNGEDVRVGYDLVYEGYDYTVYTLGTYECRGEYLDLGVEIASLITTVTIVT